LDGIKFIYLAFGPRPVIERELKYSIGALLAELPAAAGDVVVFTDRPDRYAGNEALFEIVDIAADIAEMTDGWKYPFRAKPCVLARALQTFDRPCVFMDADSFVERGFASSIVKQIEARQAVMNRYLRPNPFPELAGCSLELPSGRAYAYDPDFALMYNSGLIAVQPRHLPAIRDSIALIDRLWARSRFARDIEQFAIAECLRLHGFAIAENAETFIHYWKYWKKRYMHWRLARLPHFANGRIVVQRPTIRLTRMRTDLFKGATVASDLTARVFANLADMAATEFGRRPETSLPAK
jgi:hypothetical protein